MQLKQSLEICKTLIILENKKALIYNIKIFTLTNQKKSDKLKISGKKKVKLWTEISKIQNRTKIEKTDTTPNSPFEKVSKVNQPLARLMKGREETQITDNRNERGKKTIQPTDIKRIIREYYEQPHANEL